MSLIGILLKFLFTAFNDDMRKKQVRDYRNIQFDQNTKSGVLHDQLSAYFAAKTIEEKFQIEEYILKIIDGMKRDYKEDITRLQVLEDIVYELKFNSNNKKAIVNLLRQL